MPCCPGDRPAPPAARALPALPEVTEKISHGEPTWFVRQGLRHLRRPPPRRPGRVLVRGPARRPGGAGRRRARTASSGRPTSAAAAGSGSGSTTTRSTGTRSPRSSPTPTGRSRRRSWWPGWTRPARRLAVVPSCRPCRAGRAGRVPGPARATRPGAAAVPARGAGLGRAVARLPRADRRGHRAPRGRLLPARPRLVRPAAGAAHPAVHARGGGDRACPALRAALGLDRPVLVGHSDGASIALLHAAGGPVARAGGDRPARVRRGARAARDRGGPGPVPPRATCAPGWPATTATPTPRSATGTTSGWTRRSGTGTCAPSWPRSRCPVLAVQGTADPYGTPRTSRPIRDAAAGPVELLLLAGGHAPHLEHPDAVTAAVVATSSAACGDRRVSRPSTRPSRSG